MAKMISRIYNSGIARREIYSEPADRSQKRAILDWTGYRFDCYDSYAIRARLKNAGFLYSSATRSWWTKDPRKAIKFIEYATRDAQKQLEDV